MQIVIAVFAEEIFTREEFDGDDGKQATEQEHESCGNQNRIAYSFVEGLATGNFLGQKLPEKRGAAQSFNQPDEQSVGMTGSKPTIIEQMNNN